MAARMRASGVLALVAVLGLALPCSAAVELFMKIDGIDGESTDANHMRWIEILSYSHRVSTDPGGGASTGGVRRRGQAEHSDFTVTKELDKATPKLNEHCCKGKVFPKVTVEVCLAAGPKSTIMTYELKNCLIRSVSVSCPAEGGMPVETVSFTYEEIEWAYNEIDSMGKSKGRVEATWRVEKGEE